MRPVTMGESRTELRLDASVSGFADRVPLLSARSLVSQGQRNFFLGLLIFLVVGLLLNVRVTVPRSLPFHAGLPGRRGVPGVPSPRSSRKNAVKVVTDEEALSVPGSELPFYTVLIAAYKEPSVILKLIENLAEMDYPDDRLEVLLLLEQDDHETLEALHSSNPPRSSGWSSSRPPNLAPSRRH